MEGECGGRLHDLHGNKVIWPFRSAAGRQRVLSPQEFLWSSKTNKGAELNQRVSKHEREAAAEQRWDCIVTGWADGWQVLWVIASHKCSLLCDNILVRLREARDRGDR